MNRTDKVRISIVQESTAGTTPGTPAMLTIEHASYSEQPNTPRAASDIIRTDARVKSSVPLNRSANCSFAADLCYPTVSEGLWTMIRAAIHAVETSAITTTLSGVGNGIADADGTPTIIRSAGSFVSDGWLPGSIGQITGASSIADNRFFRVLTVAALIMTVELPDSATWAADDTSVVATLNAGMIDNSATSERSHSVEVAYLDTSNMDVFKGQVVDTMSMSFAMGQKTTVSFGLLGRDVTYGAMSSSTVGVAGATYTATTDLPVFSAAQSILLCIGGVLYPARSFSLSTSRGLRQRFSTSGGAIPDAIVPGRFTVGIQMSLHREVVDLLNYATAGTNKPIWLVMSDGAGRTIGLSMGVVAIETATTQGGGTGADVMVNVTGSSTYDSSSASVLKFFR